MLQQKQAETIRPKRIIPFRKTKQDAIQAYEAAVKKVLYVPKELKNASFLEGFRGVYLPYWGIDVEIPRRDMRFRGHRTYTEGRYDYHETYDVDAQIGGQVEGAVYDASAAFDDTLAAQIAPFDQGGSKDFDEAYLAGFYADKVTADPQIYRSLAVEQAADKVFENIQHKAGKVSVSLPVGKEKRIETIGAKATGERVSLFPVWFLTWRKKDRVAYSVMNGQSGKIFMDLPVDLKTFFLYSAIVAVALFLVLSILPAFIQPMTMAALCAVLLVASGRILNGELKQIRLQEQHLYDYGNMSGEKKAKPKPKGISCLQQHHRQRRYRRPRVFPCVDRADRVERAAASQRRGHAPQVGYAGRPDRARHPALWVLRGIESGDIPQRRLVLWPGRRVPGGDFDQRPVHHRPIQRLGHPAGPQFLHEGGCQQCKVVNVFSRRCWCWRR